MRTLNHETGAERLLALAASADACNNCDGSEWYVRKSAWIRRHKGALTMTAATAIYAILSTNSSVAENDKNYLRVVAGERARHFGNVLERIELALSGDIVGALTFKNAAKVATFYLNLRFPMSAHGATIDRHAADILTADRATSKAILARANLTGYAMLEAIYVEVASTLGVRAHELQAATWVHWVECLKRAERNEWGGTT